MVDPNRKINRLSDNDISFLDLCEEKFANRFTESDEQFQAHCQKQLPLLPPVLPEFEQQRHNHHGGYNRNRRGGGGGYNNHRNHRGGRGGHRGAHNFNYKYQ